VVLLEGPRVLSTAVRLGAEILFVMREDSAAGAIFPDTERLLRERGTEVLDLPAESLREFADTESPQGLLAVARQPRAVLPEPSESGSDGRAGGNVLVLDRLQDPGNAGTLVRVAAAFGLERVFALDGTVDPWSARATRGSAGLIFKMPVHSLTWTRASEWLEARASPLIVADPQGEDLREWLRSKTAGSTASSVGRDNGESLPSTGWALLLGHETTGPRPEALAAAWARIAIPMEEGVDSLSVATAGAILLWALGLGSDLSPELRL
jgi:TrmH family RNA methyltransferase